mgnify:CR=1 FL=1
MSCQFDCRFPEESRRIWTKFATSWSVNKVKQRFSWFITKGIMLGKGILCGKVGRLFQRQGVGKETELQRHSSRVPNWSCALGPRDSLGTLKFNPSKLILSLNVSSAKLMISGWSTLKVVSPFDVLLKRVLKTLVSILAGTNILEGLQTILSN